jgi:adenylosuccinate lyase
MDTRLLPVWVKKLVFVERLEEQMRLLFNIPFAAKFGGATEITMHIMWLIHKSTGENLEENLLKKILHHSFPTTQIEHYDHFAAFFDALKESIPSS